MDNKAVHYHKLQETEEERKMNKRKNKKNPDKQIKSPQNWVNECTGITIITSTQMYLIITSTAELCRHNDMYED